MVGNNSIWFFEEVNLYDILCPTKVGPYLKDHPLDTYDKGEFLFMEGDKKKEIFLIAGGKVKVGYYDNLGNEYVMAFLGQGELLGETALFEKSVHKEFAQVVTNNTTICKLSVDKAQELARDYVPFALTLNKKFGERLHRMERRLHILLCKDALHRLLEFLKDLCTDYGKPYGATGVKVILDITQSDIAALIGTSRKTVSLLFSDLENENVIKFYGRKEFLIPDIAKLNAMLKS
jgi:CRP-like cAMP-binding protein